MSRRGGQGRELVRLAARGRGVSSRCFCLKSLSGRIAASLRCVIGGLPPLSHAPVRFAAAAAAAAAAGLKSDASRVRETRDVNSTAVRDESILMCVCVPLKKEGGENRIDLLLDLFLTLNRKEKTEFGC